MMDEMDAYLRGILPLLDEEKIAHLLSKGPHVVDKVFDIAQTDERLKEIVQSIYDAGTNQSLIDKLDGNKALMDAGHTNFEDFYFNCEAKQEELIKVAGEDAFGSHLPHEDKIAKNLHWDVPAEHAFKLFSDFVFSILHPHQLPDNTEKLERVYNYLRFQLTRHGIEVLDLPEFHKQIEEKLPNVLDLPAGKTTKTESLAAAKKAMKPRQATSYGGTSRSFMFQTGSCTISGLTLSGSTTSISWNNWHTVACT
jgi:hypothetical protein